MIPPGPVYLIVPAAVPATDDLGLVKADTTRSATVCPKSQSVMNADTEAVRVVRLRDQLFAVWPFTNVWPRSPGVKIGSVFPDRESLLNAGVHRQNRPASLAGKKRAQNPSSPSGATMTIRTMAT